MYCTSPCVAFVPKLNFLFLLFFNYFDFSPLWSSSFFSFEMTVLKFSRYPTQEVVERKGRLNVFLSASGGLIHACAMVLHFNFPRLETEISRRGTITRNTSYTPVRPPLTFIDPGAPSLKCKNVFAFLPSFTPTTLKKGMRDFLDTHRCNAICRHLGLPSHGEDRYRDPVKEPPQGKKPSSLQMMQQVMYAENKDSDDDLTNDVAFGNEVLFCETGATGPRGGRKERKRYIQMGALPRPVETLRFLFSFIVVVASRG